MKSANMKRDVIDATLLERVAMDVEKPARYMGGEYNSIVKEWNSQRIKVALAFPDIYDLGMSNLGLATLYEALNNREDMLAERVYLPWRDMEAVMQSEGVPLFSLETRHPVAAFDLIGISIPYEQLYTNVLHLLHLSGIPLLASERLDGHYPLIVAGGHAVYNPEPMAAFVDGFLVGEGEEAIVDIAESVRSWMSDRYDSISDARRGNEERLRRLAQIEGMYVPRFYEVEYDDDGRVAEMRSIDHAVRTPVLKRIVKQLPPPVTKFIVPAVDVVHNRAAIEIMRGCTRGCRFCQAGMITRPVRERSVDEVTTAVGEMITASGFEEVALLSLSSSDFDNIAELVGAISNKYGHLNLNISLPSLRIETVSVDLMDQLRSAGRKGGFTLAPEAASERMRDIINKPMSTRQVLDTAREIYARGWRTIKLYFMIGHPAETLEDVGAIVDLAKAVMAEGRKVMGYKARLNIGVSTFVPKPHTPFQWSPSDSYDQVTAKQALLRREVKGKGIKLSLNNVRSTMMESWLSRGDRRMANVILDAYRGGARFDGWREFFDYEAWMDGFRRNNLDPYFYTHRVRKQDEIFPWDHIDAGLKKSFLIEDYGMALEGETRVDCRDQCFACGILPKFVSLRKETKASEWECPEVKPIRLRKKARGLATGGLIRPEACRTDAVRLRV